MRNTVRQPTLRERLLLFWGKLRRLYLIHFRPGYVKKMQRRRRGECARSGACCQLAWPCPPLEQAGDGNTACRIHPLRPSSCRAFPIDERDLRDRDIVMPDVPCGYYFVSQEAEETLGKSTGGITKSALGG